MVRLVTGMCVQVALGQLTKDDVIEGNGLPDAFTQKFEFACHALYLTEVEYPKGYF